MLIINYCEINISIIVITTFFQFLIAPEMMDPKANVKGDNFSWACKIPRAPVLVDSSSVQSYAKIQEQQNSSCINKSAADHRYQMCVTQPHHLPSLMSVTVLSLTFIGLLSMSVILRMYVSLFSLFIFLLSAKLKSSDCSIS